MTDEETEKLAEVFHEAFRKHQEQAPPWNSISDTDKAATIAGVHAVLDALNDVRFRSGG
jgi:hypothetical protein